VKPITNHRHLHNALAYLPNTVSSHRFAQSMKGQCDTSFNGWLLVYYGKVAISAEMSEAIHQTFFNEESPYQFKAIRVKPLTAEQYLRSHKRRSV
jgi:hypothetical protein